MNEFSFLSVLISVILGLAVTQILKGFRGIVLSRGRIKMYWPVPASGAADAVAPSDQQLCSARFGLFVQALQPFDHFFAAITQFMEMHGSQLLDQRFAFSRELKMALAPIALTWLSAKKFSLNQTIDNVNGRVMLDLKTLAELRNCCALGSAEGFDGEEGFILLRVEAGLGAEVLFTKA